MSVVAKFEGWPETERILLTIASQATRKDLLASAMLRAAGPIVESAKQRARRQTGEMAETIAAKRVEGEEHGAEVVVKIGADTGKPHWQIFHLHELGTVKMPAQPMVRPAWDEERGTFDEAVGAEIRPAIDRAAKAFARSGR